MPHPIGTRGVYPKLQQTGARMKQRRGWCISPKGHTRTNRPIIERMLPIRTRDLLRHFDLRRDEHYYVSPFWPDVRNVYASWYSISFNHPATGERHQFGISW